MPQAIAPRARRGSRVETLGNLVYVRSSGAKARGASPVTVLGLASVADADAYRAASPVAPLPAGAVPDDRLGLPGATLRIDPSDPFPLVVEVSGALADLRPLDLLAKVRFRLDALGLIPGAPPRANAAPGGPVRLGLLKGRDWNQSLHPSLESALDAFARQGGNKAGALTLQSEQPRHRPKPSEAPDGVLLASIAMAESAGATLVRAGDGPDGFVVVTPAAPAGVEAGALLPGGCPPALQGVLLPEIGLPETVERAASGMGAVTVADLGEMEAPALVGAGASLLDVERARVAVRRADAVARLARPLPVVVSAPVPRRHAPGTLLREITDSLAQLPAPDAAYLARRLGLSRGAPAAVVPGTARPAGAATDALRGLPWVTPLARRLARLSREAPAPLDAILSEPWAEGLTQGGFAFLAGVAFPACHVVDVRGRPCIVPGNERGWREAWEAAMAAILADADAAGREELAEAALDAMDGRPVELREAVLAGLMPTGPDWRLAMFLDLGGLDHAVREWLRAGGDPEGTDALSEILARLRGVAFPREGVAERLARAVADRPAPPPSQPEPVKVKAKAGFKDRIASELGSVLSDGVPRTYSDLHAAVTARLGRGVSHGVFTKALREATQAWCTPGSPTKYAPRP